MKLRARWNGKPPLVGEYLMAPMKPRYAYRIVEVERTDRIVSWDPVLKTEFCHYSIVCIRIDKRDVPEGATVYPWSWDKRASAKTKKKMSQKSSSATR